MLGCSDTTIIPKPPWRERKRAYIAHLTHASDDVLLVSCCDKLHKARATVIDLHEHGPAFWQGGKDGVTFNAGPADQVWYYQSLVIEFLLRFEDQPSRQPLVHELSRTVTTLATLASAEVATE